MQMNSSLILQGQPVNVLAAIMDAQEAAKGQYGFDRQRGYDNMLAANGPGIVAGETGALNALAGYDPKAALGAQDTQLGMQDTRLGMDATRQRMDILDAQERRAVETYAAGLDAAQAAAEAAQTEEAIKMGMMIPDAATWDAQMAQIAPDLVGQFANREALAARFMSMAEILKERAGAEPKDRYTNVPDVGLVDLAPEGGGAPAVALAPPPKPADASAQAKLWADEQAGKVPKGTYETTYGAKPADDYERYRAREVAAGRVPLSDIEFAQAMKGKGMSISTDARGTTTVTFGGAQGGSERLQETAAAETAAVRATIADIKAKLTGDGFFDLPEVGIVGERLARWGVNQEAVDVKDQLATLTGTVAFDKLQRIRMSSPTGGALGAVSDKEMKMLEAALGSLATTSSPKLILRTLETIDGIMAKLEAYPTGTADNPGSPGAAADPLQGWAPETADFFRQFQRQGSP